MDVSCPQCDTLYELDDDQLDADGATLKCSQCEHLFRLEPRSGVQSESQQRWMVRQSGSGEFLYFTGFDTLHEWIMEGRVDAADAISRTGESWKRLGEIGEFAPIFQVVESIADISESSSADSGGDRSADSAERPAPETAVSETSSDGASRPHQTPPSRGAPTEPEARTPHPERTTDRESEETPETVDDRDVETADDGPSSGSRPQTEDESGAGTGASVPLEQQETSEVQFEERRFGEQSTGGDSGEASSDDWTLGELEHERAPETELEDWESSSRRWPVVLVVVVAAGVAVGYWQWDRIETMTDDLVVEVGIDGLDREAGSEGDEETATEKVPFAEVETAVQRGVEAGERDATRRLRSRAVAGAVEETNRSVGRAGEAADEEAQREPTVPEMLAAGRRSLDRGNAEQAKTRFERVLEKAPDSAEARAGLGWAHLAAQRPDAAVEQFQRARSLDPELGDALIGLGRAQRSRGRQEAALSAYEEYMERFPDGDQLSIAEYQSRELRDSLE